MRLPGQQGSTKARTSNWFSPDPITMDAFGKKIEAHDGPVAGLWVGDICIGDDERSDVVDNALCFRCRWEAHDGPVAGLWALKCQFCQLCYILLGVARALFRVEPTNWVTTTPGGEATSQARATRGCSPWAQVLRRPSLLDQLGYLSI